MKYQTEGPKGEPGTEEDGNKGVRGQEAAERGEVSVSEGSKTSVARCRS
jgi:hypothetical protein